MYITEIMEKLNCTEKEVLDIKHEFHIRTKERVEYHDYYIIFTEEDANFVMKTYRERLAARQAEKEKRELEAEKKFQEALKTAKIDHPLITDERCLKLSWWPDPTPECFKELD